MKFMPFPKPGEPLSPPDIHQLPTTFGIWLFSMIGWVVIQMLTIQWTLKTKWSDFKLEVVSTKENNPESTKTN